MKTEISQKTQERKFYKRTKRTEKRQIPIGQDPLVKNVEFNALKSD